MSKNKDQIDELLKPASLMPLSTAWPPVLGEEETIMFQGGFDRNAWLNGNVYVVLGLVGLFIFFNLVFDIGVSTEGISFILILTIIGALVTFLIYRNQQWLISDRAVYIKRSSPMALQSIKKMGGFGSTIRFAMKFGLGKNLVGVVDAKTIRHTLSGRK